MNSRCGSFFGPHNNNAEANQSGRRHVLGSLALPEFTVVWELITETTESISGFGADATTEMKNDVAEFIDYREISI